MAQVVWETKSVQTPSGFIGRKRLSTVLVISTISSFFFVLIVMIFIFHTLLARVCAYRCLVAIVFRNYITNSDPLSPRATVFATKVADSCGRREFTNKFGFRLSFGVIYVIYEAFSFC